MATLLLIVLVLLLIGAVPAWPYNNGWGYYPSGGVGLLVAIVLLLALFRRDSLEFLMFRALRASAHS